MKEINNNVLEVLMGFVKSSCFHIPIIWKDERQPSKNRKVTPNWDKEVKPFKSATIYWHAQEGKEGTEQVWLYDTMVWKRKNITLLSRNVRKMLIDLKPKQLLKE